MKSRTRMTVAAAASVGLWLVGLNAQAGTIVCDIDAPNAKNYMEISDAEVASCIDAGKGTLSGNNSGGNPDEFLSSAAGAGYETISKTGGDANPFNLTYSVSADGLSGSWSFDASAWDFFSPDTTSLVLGFKWGTGNTFDEYFLFDVVAGVSSGSFDWFPLAVTGGGTGGLSHMILYAANTSTSTSTSTSSSGDVPEPGTLTLLGLGLLGLGAARRRSR